MTIIFSTAEIFNCRTGGAVNTYIDNFLAILCYTGGIAGYSRTKTK